MNDGTDFKSANERMTERLRKSGFDKDTTSKIVGATHDRVARSRDNDTYRQEKQRK